MTEQNQLDPQNNAAPAAPSGDGQGQPVNDQGINANQPKTGEEVLYELPDGRKVNGEELTREWKENFLPEFTRSHQELAEYKKNPPNQPNQPDIPDWQKPDWVPNTFGDVIKIAEERGSKRAIEEITGLFKQQADAQQLAEKEVENQTNEIKKADPNVDMNRVYSHANKYHFNDLKVAYQNMKDMEIAVKQTEKNTVQNIQNRNEPVNGASGGAPSKGSEIDPNILSSKMTPQEYLAKTRK